jgi:microcystin degradation protein MlrC
VGVVRRRGRLTLRIFTALFATETNTFSPIPTGWRSFSKEGLYHDDASLRAPELFDQTPLGEWRRLANAEGHTLIEGLAAQAAPAGRVLQTVYARLRDELVQSVQAAAPLDMILLDLHGAMAAEGVDDCTFDILTHVRAVVGPDIAIGVELDLHCQITRSALDLANITICYKEYPHTDIIERAREVYQLTSATAQGRARPTTGLFDCKMVGAWPTIRQPMIDFVQRMQAFEGRDGVLSVSLAHGFPWGDVPACGAKLWVIMDGDQNRAEALAEQLGREFYALRGEMIFPHESIDQALDAALESHSRPWIIADVADNAGGGAPGDSTFILRRLIERGVRDAALGCIADPSAVDICFDAGLGARFDLRLGGKYGRASGPPLDLTVTVRGLSEDHAQGPTGARIALGASAWVETAGIDLVICKARHQVFTRDAFTGLGVDLAGKTLIVVKSSQHFYADFSQISADIRYVSTAGALDLDFARIPYVRRDLNYWPRVADPLSS